jgi:hypothetical protein
MFVLIMLYIDIRSSVVTYERLLDSEESAPLTLLYFLALRSSNNLDLPYNILVFFSTVYHSVYVYIKVKI